MDETLIMTAVDISGRALLCFDVEIPQKTVGAFDTELAGEFMLSFVRNAGITLHMHKLYGKTPTTYSRAALNRWAGRWARPQALTPVFRRNPLHKGFSKIHGRNRKLQGGQPLLLQSSFAAIGRSAIVISDAAELEKPAHSAARRGRLRRRRRAASQSGLWEALIAQSEKAAAWHLPWHAAAV